MIVEDQRLIAADLESTLGKLGYEVVANVAAGEEAVPRALELQPELILMDIRLRGPMDGIEAATAIRARSELPIVYLTAYADEETLVRAKATTPFGYLVKPFNERELRAAIEIAIYKHDTERLLADERAQRRSAEEIKLLVQNVKDYAIYMLDPTGRVATWNEGARRITGYRPEEILGKHFSLFYTPEDVSAGTPQALLEASLREGRVEAEGWRVRKDGTRYWADLAITPIHDGEGSIRGFGTVTRDLSERKRAEESLAAERALLRSAFVNAPAYICVLRGPDHVFELANPRYHELLGHRPIEGRPVREVLPELEPDGYFQLLDRVLQTGEPAYGNERPARIQRPDGSLVELYFNFVYQPMLGREGRAEGIIAFGFDVTSQVQARRQLEVLAREREQLVVELRNAVRARDEFLQIASHELKTPLTPLVLQLETLGRALGNAGVQNEQLSEKLARATRQTLRLSRLIESLLDVSRITAGRFELELEPLELAGLVQDVVERFRAEARKAGSEIVANAEPPIVGRWDRQRLEQILSNLLSNAIKYGGGKPIVVDTSVANGTVRIAVKDQGIGIARDALGRIFARFERAVSMRNFSGLGLGLFIARQFAEAHGGTIVVHSQPGTGSTFTVVLPLESAAAQAAQGEAGR